MDDNNFIKKYEAHQNESAEDFIRKYAATQAELRDIIAYLIQHREMMRDSELERMKGEAEALIAQLAENKNEMLLEELTCFKDILALQKTLIEENDKPRD